MSISCTCGCLGMAWAWRIRSAGGPGKASSAVLLTWSPRRAAPGDPGSGAAPTRRSCMRREELYLADLVEDTQAVRGYLDGISRERWEQDRCCVTPPCTGCCCSARSPARCRTNCGTDTLDVAWRQIRAFRNFAVHKYFGVGWAVVWKIAQDEAPLLEEQAMAIMRAEYPDLAQTYEPGPMPEPRPARGGQQSRALGTDTGHFVGARCDTASHGHSQQHIGYQLRDSAKRG